MGETPDHSSQSAVKNSRTAGFAIIGATYLVASLIGITIFLARPDVPLFPRLLFIDVVCTVFVFAVGVLFGNASVYDPYWSVAPILLATGVAAWVAHVSVGSWLLLIVIWIWGIRLTANWAFTFRNLNSEDWRYRGLRTQFPRAFQLVSLAGIHLFPTLVVFVCLMPALDFMWNAQGTTSWWVLPGLVIGLVGIGLELVADLQMQRFRAASTGGIIRVGLWRHARHPNYLGEILMWWGVYLFVLPMLPNDWLLGLGALANTAMFLFISIPMADRRNRARFAGFDDYVAQTSSLWPLPRRSSRNLEA